MTTTHPASADKPMWCIKIMGAANPSGNAGVNKFAAPFSYGIEKPNMNGTGRAVLRGVHKRIIRMGMKMLELPEITTSWVAQREVQVDEQDKQTAKSLSRPKIDHG